MPTSGTNLQILGHPGGALVAGVLVLTTAFGLATWHAHSARELPVSEVVVNATSPVGQPIYLGVFAGGEAFDRTLHVSGVKVHTTSNTDVSVTPLLCRGGRVGVTTDPEAFCDELVNPEGEIFTSGDHIVLQVISAEPALAVIDRVRLGFRENLQWATYPAGASAIVRIIAR